jgi:glycosyltransferase involved in cell wall biosynthesis
VTGDIHYITLGLSPNRTINTFHDFTFLKTKNGIKHFFLRFFWVIIPIKLSKALTVISETTLEELLKIAGEKTRSKTFIIPNIIPPQFKYCASNFNQTQPKILHIGTTPNKNIERLILALKNINCHLLLVGELSTSVSTLLNMHNISYSNYYNINEDELLKVYQKCDILSFCSLNEGFGMPIIEAQVIGRPVVTSNISSMPEIAGDGACFVDPYDVMSIRAGITKVIYNESYRNSIVQKGLKNINRYNPKVVGSAYMDIYYNIYDGSLNKK